MYKRQHLYVVLHLGMSGTLHIPSKKSITNLSFYNNPTLPKKHNHVIIYFDNIKLIKPIKNRTQDTLNFKQKLFHLSQRSLASKGYIEIVTWSFTDSKIDKQFSKSEKEISIFNPISTDLDVLRRSIFSNLAIYIKKNQDRGYEDLSLFEVGPTFFGKNPGEQQIVVGGLKSGKINRKSWLCLLYTSDAADD